MTTTPTGRLSPTARLQAPWPGSLLVSLALAAAMPSHAVELLGSTGVSYPVGDNPTAVAVADLDEDGVPDLAVTNLQSDTVTILLGDGSGGFGRRRDEAVGCSPQAIVAGHFDTDGHLDLATADQGSAARACDGTVTVLLGDGRGGILRTESIEDVGRSPVDLELADLDGDGLVDLAVLARSDGAVTVLLGDGLGSFAPTPQRPDAGFFPVSFTAANVAGDAALDLVAANPQLGMVSILEGNGDGTFVEPPAMLPTGSFPVAVAAGDLNGDGAVDLAVANLNDDTVSLLRGAPDGGFATSVSVAVGDEPVALAVGDLDDDGSDDLVVTNRRSNTMSILSRDAAGGLVRRCTERQPQAECGERFLFSASGPVLGDLDGDGAEDLVVVSDPAGTVSVLLGDGLGGFAAAAQLPVEAGPQRAVSADFNGDGALDLAVTNTLAGSVSILLNDPAGGPLATDSYPDLGSEPVGIAAGRFDDDATLDLAVARRGSSRVTLLLGRGDGTFATGPDLIVASRPERLLAEDIDGDGLQDLVVVHTQEFVFANKLSLLRGRGAGAFSVETRDIRTGPGTAALGHLDGDGNLDLMVSNEDADVVQVFLSNGPGTFGDPFDVPVGDAPTGLLAADFDGGGDLDLAVALSGEGITRIFTGDGTGALQEFADVPVGLDPRDLAAADLNDDGLLDLTAVNSEDGTLSILLGDGAGDFARVADLGAGTQPLAVVAGDYDLDDATDLITVNRFGDSITFLPNQLARRIDLNGSNRTDGFDISALSLLAGAIEGEDPRYRRSADVDLNGVINGQDLAKVAGGFGRLIRRVSVFDASPVNPVPADPGTVTFQGAGASGDLLAVDVMVNEDDLIGAADLTVIFEPDDTLPTQVLTYVSFEAGTVLSGDIGQLLSVDPSTPGRVLIKGSRLPAEDRASPGAEPLLTLLFRARRAGTARLDFAPGSKLLFGDGDGTPVPGLAFVGGVQLVVEESSEDTPGQRIGFTPRELDFGEASPGMPIVKALRISNFGFSDLTLLDVVPSRPEFSTFLTHQVTIPPLGFVRLTVTFTPGGPGVFQGTLELLSDDPDQPNVAVPLIGRSP